jgi:hypothetical protein
MPYLPLSQASTEEKRNVKMTFDEGVSKVPQIPHLPFL